MSELTDRCMVSGADGQVTITPAGRITLTETPSPSSGADLDRIADDVGPDVALRTLGGNGGTAAILGQTDGVNRLTMTGRVAAMIELPTATWFVTPTGTDGHTVGIPGDALQLVVGLYATVPDDLVATTTTSISDPRSQTASRFFVNLIVAAACEPTPVGLEVVDLSVGAEITPAPVPVAPVPGTPSPGSTPSAVSDRAAPPPAVAPSSSAPGSWGGHHRLPPNPSAVIPTAATPAPGAAPRPSEPDDPNLVLGIRCPLDHHNHPDAEYCSQCGRKMGINATAMFVKIGRRPREIVSCRRPLRGPRPPSGSSCSTTAAPSRSPPTS